MHHHLYASLQVLCYIQAGQRKVFHFTEDFFISKSGFVPKSRNFRIFPERDGSPAYQFARCADPDPPILEALGSPGAVYMVGYPRAMEPGSPGVPGPRAVCLATCPRAAEPVSPGSPIAHKMGWQLASWAKWQGTRQVSISTLLGFHHSFVEIQTSLWNIFIWMIWRILMEKYFVDIFVTTSPEHP